MEILPILRALRRNRTGPLLVGLQIAVTLAIVCNSMSIIQQRLQQMKRPSGLDEANIFTLENSWLGKPADLKALIEADLSAVRSVPDVVDAYATNSVPLLGIGRGSGVGVEWGGGYPGSTDEFFTDQHGLPTLGIKLVAGRWFSARDVSDLYPHDDPTPATIVVTRALAKALFPGTEALGQVIYLRSNTPSRIVGIIERAEHSRATNIGNGPFVEFASFLPYHFIDNGLLYVVRTRPGQLPAVMQAVQDRLYAQTQQRVIENVRPFSETRARAYSRLRASLTPLSEVCALLLAVTVCGVIGLTSYSVAQRRRYIGMRRALGASRVDILRYFHTENLLIAGAGCVLGAIVGLAGNTWLALSAEVTRMSVSYICIVACIVLALCQAAVLWPALRAALIPPASAIRNE